MFLFVAYRKGVDILNCTFGKELRSTAKKENVILIMTDKNYQNI